MANLNYGERATCEPRDNKTETAKAILENTDAILQELYNELRRIDDAIYSPKNDEISQDVIEPKQECFLGKLNRHRNVAEAMLHLAVHIREGLW